MLETETLEFPRFANGQLACEVTVDDVLILNVLAIHGR